VPGQARQKTKKTKFVEAGPINYIGYPPANPNYSFELQMNLTNPKNTTKRQLFLTNNGKGETFELFGRYIRVIASREYAFSSGRDKYAIDIQKSSEKNIMAVFGLAIRVNNPEFIKLQEDYADSITPVVDGMMNHGGVPRYIYSDVSKVLVILTKLYGTGANKLIYRMNVID
jgi:hypothetical protein